MSYVGEAGGSPQKELSAAQEAAAAFQRQEIPEWFRPLEKRARRVARHDMNAIRESVARGVSDERWP